MTGRAVVWAGTVAAIVAALMAGQARGADRFIVRDLTAISGANPFSADCGLRVPPPFEQSDFRPKDTGAEPHVAVDPLRPERVIATWHQDFSTTTPVAASGDGGRTWTVTTVPGVGECTGGHEQAPVDPALAIGRGGMAYLVIMSGHVDPGSTTPTNAVLVNRSTDGGRTWSSPVVVEPSNGYNDHPSIVVDPRDPQRVAVAWADLEFILGSNTAARRVAISEDGGRTFGPSRSIGAPRPGVNTAQSVLQALDDGTIVLSYGEVDSPAELLPASMRPPRRMIVQSSRDGGITWDEPITLGTQVRAGPTDPQTGQGITRENGPSLATGPRGVVAAWSDLQPDGNASILLARSRDGRTWAPTSVTRRFEHPVFLPTVAQSGDGRLGMWWYDTRPDAAGDKEFTVETRFASSDDDGTTWVERELGGRFDLRTAWTDPRAGLPLIGGGNLFLGDYMGMVGLPHDFLPVFVQARPQAKLGRSQVFAARVTRLRALRLAIRPPTVTAGRRVRLRVVVTTRDGERRARPVDGALVRLLAKRAAPTGAASRASNCASHPPGG